jgi:hypothetical protein
MSFALAVLLLWLQLQFGALRVLERLPGAAGDIALLVVWAASAAALWALLRHRPRWALLRTPWPAAVLLVLVAVCAAFVYPAVDDRRSTGGGSDADDAVVLVVEQVRGGDDPFARDTYLGSPPTTGPGSVLWALPFPGKRAYAAGIVLAVGAVLLALRRWFGWEVASLTAILLAGCVPFWEGVAQGNDHVTMACGVAIVVAAVEHRRRTVAPASTAWWLALAAGAGVLATWRAAYLYLPVLLAIVLWRRSRREAILVAAVGIGLALVLHAALLSRTASWDDYDPVHQLAVKSDEDLGDGGRALVLGAAIAGAVVALGEARRERPDPATLVLAGIGAPLAAIALAGAVTAEEPAAWSEASYLLVTLVVAAVVAARAVVESRAP